MVSHDGITGVIVGGNFTWPTKCEDTTTNPPPVGDRAVRPTQVVDHAHILYFYILLRFCRQQIQIPEDGVFY